MPYWRDQTLTTACAAEDLQFPLIILDRSLVTRPSVLLTEGLGTRLTDRSPGKLTVGGVHT